MEIIFFLHPSLKQFLFSICTNIHYMVLNCKHKRNFDFVYKSCNILVLNSVTDMITKKNQPPILHVQVDSAIPVNQHVKHNFYNNNKNMAAS